MRYILWTYVSQRYTLQKTLAIEKEQKQPMPFEVNYVWWPVHSSKLVGVAYVSVIILPHFLIFATTFLKIFCCFKICDDNLIF